MQNEKSSNRALHKIKEIISKVIGVTF